MENWNGIPIVGLSAPALLSLVFFLIVTGRLVPRPTMQDKIEEAQHWREAYEKEREARSLANSQSKDLLVGLQTNHEIVTAIFKNIEIIRDQGVKHVASKD